MKQLRYTDVARNDLVDAWLYLAEKSQPAADEMLAALTKDVERLAMYPQLGRHREDLVKSLPKSLHSWPSSTGYMIYYQHSERELLLVRVLHHTRDILQAMITDHLDELSS
ncbi:MAG: type II toxin-antitoxin system RelE/ParE family toxin [Pseudomonadota bacterium]